MTRYFISSLVAAAAAIPLLSFGITASADAAAVDTKTVEATVAAAGVQQSVLLDENFGAESGFSNITSPAPDDRNLHLGADMGEPQVISSSHGRQILDKIVEDRQYIEQQVMVEDKYESVRNICKNQHESCTFWAIMGECDVNPGTLLL
jgi:hypothetical protein